MKVLPASVTGSNVTMAVYAFQDYQASDVNARLTTGAKDAKKVPSCIDTFHEANFPVFILFAIRTWWNSRGSGSLKRENTSYNEVPLPVTFGKVSLRFFN